MKAVDVTEFSSIFFDRIVHTPVELSIEILVRFWSSSLGTPVTFHSFTLKDDIVSIHWSNMDEEVVGGQGQ